jgi:NAD(P)-dependent dehydrogenase (short-subunit alcohol dehydrogenase family)
MKRLAASDEIRDAWLQANPMRRFGSAREVANVALFLCSEAASYVNGAIIHCDGGQVLGGGRDFSASWAELKSRAAR